MEAATGRERYQRGTAQEGTGSLTVAVRFTDNKCVDQSGGPFYTKITE